MCKKFTSTAKHATNHKCENFEESLKLFIKVNKINPDDSVTEIFIKRCQKIIKEGYNPNLWDGINRLDYK